MYKVLEANINNNGHLLGKLEHVEKQEQREFIVFDKEISDLHKSSLRTGNVIDIIIKDKDWNDKLRPKSVVTIEEARLGLTPLEQEQHLAEINQALYWFDENQKQTALSQAMCSLVTQNEELLKVAPAAKGYHHNYIGGLMVHTLELIKNIADISEGKYKTETMIAACVLHDFAKIWEYSIDLLSGNVTYNSEWTEEHISHTMWAYKWAIKNGFDELADLVASHHGQPIMYQNGKNINTGAIFAPRTKEGWALHLADYLSSKVGKITIEDLDL